MIFLTKGKVPNIVSSIVGLCIAAFVYFYSNTFPKIKSMAIGPDFFPKMLAIGLALMSLFLLITALTSRFQRGFGTLSVKDKGVQRILICLAATIVFAWLIKRLGFIPSSALYMYFMCYVLGMRKHIMMIIISIAVPVVIALSFQYGLKIFLPAGILESILF